MGRVIVRYTIIGVVVSALGLQGIAFASPAPAEVHLFEQSLKAGYDALAKNNPAKAEEAFKTATRLAPKSTEPVLGLAEAAKLRGDLNGVEKWLRQARTIAPNDASVEIAWGRFYYAQKKYGDAEATYKKALTLDAKSVNAHLDLGELYMGGIPKPKEAEEQFRAAIRLQDGHAGAHNGLATALAAQQKIKEAVVEFDAAAKLAPDNPLPPYSKGRLYLLSGDPAKALSAFNQALKVKANFLPALLDRGDAYAVQGKSEKAIEDYQAAIREAPKNPTTHFRLGMFHQARKNYAEAAKAYRKTVEADPKFALAYNNLAWLIVDQSGDLGEALALARKAVDLQPAAAEFADTLGRVYQARKEIDPAIVQFRHATDAKNPRAEHAYHLGIALLEKGNRPEAIKALKRALEIDSNFSDSAEARRLIGTAGG